jgi:3-oxoacyl-[acyl-carrier protein] reductase
LDGVAALCRELRVNAHSVIGDVSDPERVIKMIRDGIDNLGKIDILVNNVAVRPHKPILETSYEEWHQVLGIDLHAAFYLIRAVLPGMMERRFGNIIALGGQAAITGRPNTAVVTTAKTGLLGLIRAVAAEMAPYNIRANMVNPGSTDTERQNPEWYPEFQEVQRGAPEHLKDIPMGREATMDDIANACLFLASDESSYITGVHLNVMGGRYII